MAEAPVGRVGHLSAGLGARRRVADLSDVAHPHPAFDLDVAVDAQPITHEFLTSQ